MAEKKQTKKNVEDEILNDKKISTEENKEMAKVISKKRKATVLAVGKIFTQVKFEDNGEERAITLTGNKVGDIITLG